MQSETKQRTRSAASVAKAVYHPRLAIGELVAQCLAKADEDELQDAARTGFEMLLSRKENQEWREVEPTGQRKNGDDKVAPVLEEDPEDDILDMGVHLRDGTAYRLGDMKLGTVQQWNQEFSDRVRTNQAGEKFTNELVRDMRDHGVSRVSALSGRRVATLRRLAGFRIRGHVGATVRWSVGKQSRNGS